MKNCYDVYKNLNIVSNNKSIEISTCCLMDTVEVNDVDFNNDTFLQTVRSHWDKYNEFPNYCRGCQQAELSGIQSRRIGINQWYVDNDCANNTVELLKIDFSTGDLCNLRCVICGPKYSSAWKNELRIQDGALPNSVINKFWKKIPLEKLKFIHFNGGEPLLSKEHVDFLMAIPNKSDVYLNYNTNGTVLASENLIKLWEQFKLVQLDFSIDDVKERFEYQRYPAKWDQLIFNLNWYINNAPVNCMFAVNTTVSILNSNNLTNLSDWLKNNFTENRLGDPIEHRQQQASGLFALENLNDKKNKIIKFLDECDSRRGTNWRKTLPELCEIL